MKKLILLLTILFQPLSSGFALTEDRNQGIGTRQAQGLGKGIVIGSLLGGVIGNQKDKSVEGVLIGGTLGAILGSEIGKNKDYRLEKEKRISKEVDYAPSKALSKYSAQTICHSHSSSNNNLPDELTFARRDAENAEAELRILETKIREKQRKEKLLNDYRMRESIARQRIMDLRAIQYYEN